MIRSARVRPRPVPRCWGRTNSRFNSHTPSASFFKATQPTGSSPTVARRRLPVGGAYWPGRSASSCSKFWKQRSKPREAAYSRYSTRTGPISSAEVKLRIVGSTGHPSRRCILDAVHIGPEDLHEAGRIGQRLETEPLVQAVGVSRAEQETPQTLQGRIVHHAFDEPFRQAATSVRLQHEHVAQPGESRPVGHDAGQADLPAPLVQPEAE